MYHYSLAVKAKILLDGRNSSPRDMFFFSFPEDGVRGLFGEPPVPDLHEDVGDIMQYGIDWEAANDSTIMDQVLDNNPNEWENDNPFRPGQASQPGQLSYVPCDAPGCPLSPFEVQELNIRLAAAEDTTTRNMAMRRKLWITALTLCGEIMARPGRQMWIHSMHV